MFLVVLTLGTVSLVLGALSLVIDDLPFKRDIRFIQMLVAITLVTILVLDRFL